MAIGVRKGSSIGQSGVREGEGVDARMSGLGPVGLIVLWKTDVRVLGLGAADPGSDPDGDGR